MNENNKKSKPKFDLNSLTSREFQAFLILLTFEGNNIPVLKTTIDTQFGHKSRTKGYDYINDLCQKGLVYKKINIEKGKKYVSIHVNKKVRSEYEKLVVPTLSNTKNIIKELIQDNLDIFKDIDKNREKLKSYTETLIDAVNDLIRITPTKSLKHERFQKKLEAYVWKYYRAEVLKATMFSQKKTKYI